MQKDPYPPSPAKKLNNKRYITMKSQNDFYFLFFILMSHILLKSYLEFI
jgi:hypothetical protein